jgi:hypothetical protein
LKRNHKALALLAIGAASLPALAVDFKVGDEIEGKFNGTMTLGSQIRTESPNPDAYPAFPASTIGAPPGKLAGQTPSSDLNYQQGNPIATVAKGVFDLDLKRQNLGVFARGSMWYDFVQGKSNVAYGNYPNGFTPGTPLSDNGFASSAKFNNAEFRDYYAYGKFDAGAGNTLDAKIGRQVLQWGGSMFTTGGINSGINPYDYASLLRPGALPFEGKLPVGMVSASLATGSSWSVDGFIPYEFRASVLPGCGTYFDQAPYAPQGCDFAGLAGLSEQKELAAGVYLHRNEDVTARAAGQFGLAVGYKSEAMNTNFRGYAMNTHSAMPSIRMTVNSTTVTNAPPYGLLANQLNANYASMYVENVALLGMSFNTKLDPTAGLFGEVAYRPNQPITLNATDLVNAFVLRAGPIAQNKGTNAIPIGGTFDGYDTFGVATASFGGNKVFPKSLGAERVVLAGEAGYSHVNGLPDTSYLRYGRALAYSAAGYAGGPACVDSVKGKTCTSDGYITPDAWGVRALASAVYPYAMGIATLTPSLLVAADISGYSYDGTFSQGRLTVRPGIRADWGKDYYAEIQYNMYSGGNYNLFIDRSFVSLVAGARF